MLLLYFRLDDLNDEKDVCCRILIEKMISSKASERPPITAIQKHPFYWSKEKVLGFFQVRFENKISFQQYFLVNTLTFYRVCYTLDAL